MLYLNWNNSYALRNAYYIIYSIPWDLILNKINNRRYTYSYRITMVRTILIVALSVTVVLVVSANDGNNCINKCVSEFYQCSGACLWIDQCRKCIDYRKSCIRYCINNTNSRKRRHSLTEKLYIYERKWVKYYKRLKQTRREQYNII